MKKVVIKIGSSTLTTKENKVDHEYLKQLAAQIAAINSCGWQSVIVSSAAIACGLEALGIEVRPQDMPSLQAAASVGQNALSNAYAKAFAPFGMMTSIVLLTRRDTADRQAYLHARDTFTRLLELGVTPVVNENDTVSVEQIRFGDNDTLAALVACLIDADLMIVLSDIDGLYDRNPHSYADASLIPTVSIIDEEIIKYGGEAGSTVGSGGMITKITAARVLMVAGIEMIICNGRKNGVIVDAVEGKQVGTRFLALKKPHEITPKKLWIALGDTAKGIVRVDPGAKRALIAQGCSLLSVGIVGLEGSFEAEDIIDIQDTSGHLFARGKISMTSDELSLACGMSQHELQANRLLEGLSRKPVVHRDDLVVFE